MLWEQTIKVYTDHKNLIQDVLGLTSNRVYHWRLLLEEYAPEIVYIKGIHNTVVDAISWLEYNPEVNEQSFANLSIPTKEHRWKGFTALWRSYVEKNPGSHEQVCCLPIVATSMRFISSLLKRLQTLKESMQLSSIASNATIVRIVTVVTQLPSYLDGLDSWNGRNRMVFMEF